MLDSIAVIRLFLNCQQDRLLGCLSVVLYSLGITR